MSTFIKTALTRPPNPLKGELTQNGRAALSRLCRLCCGGRSMCAALSVLGTASACGSMLYMGTRFWMFGASHLIFSLLNAYSYGSGTKNICGKRKCPIENMESLPFYVKAFNCSARSAALPHFQQGTQPFTTYIFLVTKYAYH